MILDQLTLVNFKNLTQKEFRFQERINCFVGQNGVGKTNVLDGIYTLSMTKSYFNPISGQNINHDADFFMLEGHYSGAVKKEKVVCSLKRGQKKVLKRNGKLYDKISEHIGLVPVVIISPADRDLIVEGSETRRKFMDSVIAQMNPVFLGASVSYNKVISQRNALLKYFHANRTFDALSLEAFNVQMMRYGEVIYRERSSFLKEFSPLFQKYYDEISGGKEEVSLNYKSALNDANFEQVLEDALPKDRAVQYSSAGVHKDDLVFELGGYPVKKFGSQGQQKTFLVALKLAQYEFLKNHTQKKPILLLDDIFDKLDDQRVKSLIQLVNADDFGQIFISDTHDDRTRAVVSQSGEGFEIFNLEHEY